MEALTPGLEDYLEAIWTISLKDKVARVKDIAKFLGVTTPSVVSAINSLLEKDLARHEKYGYVELTDEGAMRAKEVNDRHRSLFYFIHEILGIHEDVAHQNACKMEHHLSTEVMEKIYQFNRFFEVHPEEKALFFSKLKSFIEKEASAMDKNFTPIDLRPGEKGKVIKIKGKGELKKRLLDMGIVPGAEIKLEKVAPLGDPIDILIKGYHLSLRKEEAKEILLEKG